ncbi:MAG: hypothetical protein ACJATI_005482 [Halioglobus sp.]|jgi:hypothetical protein
MINCSIGPSQNIEPRFQKYVEDFISEANRRGMNLALEDIDISIMLGDIDASGNCNLRNNDVTIDEDTWSNIQEPYKTALIYHELGHCILDRRHLLEQMPNGECKSLMRATDESFACWVNFGSSLWWDYYLDELFDPNLENPNWYIVQEDYSSMNILNEELKVNEVTSYFKLDSLNLSTIENYNLDLEINNNNLSEEFFKLSIGNLSIELRVIENGIKQKVILQSSNTTLIMHQTESETLTAIENISLSIRKKDNLIHFYINELHFHTVELELWDKQNSIKSNNFKSPLEIKFRLLEIE